MKLRRFIIAATCMVTFHAFAAEPCMHYMGAPVTLNGIVIERTFYGPPNYGESPATDSRENQVVLLLQNPICVEEYKYSEDEKNQLELTLVPLGKIKFKNHIGKKVVVQGKLFHAHTGHHHTPVLVEVTSIEQFTK